MSTPLSPEIYAQLDALKDIHLPQPISFWPLAMGWWLVAALIIGLAITLWVIYLRRQASLKYAALCELNQLSQQYENQPQALLSLAAELSVLLRRVTIATQGQSMASKTQDNWLSYLTQGKFGMQQEVANFISQAPYLASAPAVAPKNEQLIEATKDWIRRHA